LSYYQRNQMRYESRLKQRSKNRVVYFLAGLLVGFVIGGCRLAVGQCVPWIDNAAYCRPNVRQWYLHPDLSDYPLFLNGVDQNSPDIGGAASIDWEYAQTKKEIKIGIADNVHGISLDYLITNVAMGSSIFHSSPDAAGIRESTSNHCVIIVCPWYTTIQGQRANDLSNACHEASQAGVILVCSVPNAVFNIDTSPALPASLNISNLIAVTSSTRQDTVYDPAAVGTNVIAAPGRVILTQDTNGNPVYATGTSYAAPIVAGTVAWMLGQFNQSPAIIVQAIRQGSVPIDSRIVGRLSMRGAVEAMRPVMGLSWEAQGIASYGLEYSEDLVEWTTTEPCDDSVSCFVRARVL